MTTQLLAQRKIKLKLFKKFKSNPSESNKKKYIDYRNQYNKQIRLSKTKMIENQIFRAKKDPKKLWSILKNAADIQNKNSSKISEILSDNKLITSKDDISEIFNEFFANIGMKKSNSVPNISTGSFKDYLPPSLTESLFFIEITSTEIINIVEGFENKTSVDINGISGKFLKRVIYPLAKPLEHIFNLSVEKGIFPENMKTSRTIPIYKKEGSQKDCTNYRPISIINCFSKVFEKALYLRLKNFLEHKKFFYANQFGFREGRNVQQAVIKTTNFVSKALNENNVVCGLFLDVSKAFDTIDRNILLYKLENAGIRGSVLELLRSYLSNRKQKVSIGDFTSEIEKNLQVGVLQGSILASLLFLIYVNDFYKCNSSLSIIFADDSNCLFRGKNREELYNEVSKNIPKIFTWFCLNKLSLNIKKTNYMLFSNNKKMISNFPQLQMNGININHISNESDIQSIRMLGVYLDPKLDFKDFAIKTLAKISKSFFIINRSKRFINEKSLKLLYFALVHSHMEFASLFLYKNNTKIISKIETLQKKIIRLISGLDYAEHTTEAFIKFGILPFSKLIEYNVSKFMWQFQCGLLPDGLKNEWPTNNSILERPYELRNNNDLNLPRTIKASIDKMTYFSFPKLWNEKKEKAGYNLDPEKFFPALKTHLLYEYKTMNECKNKSNNCYSCQVTKERIKKSKKKIIMDLKNKNAW